MMGPAGEEETGTMEDNRDVEMGSDSEGVRLGGERERGHMRLERKRGFVEHNNPGDVNMTREDMQTLISFI